MENAATGLYVLLGVVIFVGVIVLMVKRIAIKPVVENQPTARKESSKKNQES